MQSTFFCLGKFLKWLANDQSSSITKGSICYIKHMYLQPFSMEVDWWEICHQMDVSTMFYICRYCVFTLWGRYKGMWYMLTSLYKPSEHRIAEIPFPNLHCIYCTGPLVGIWRVQVLKLGQDIITLLTPFIPASLLPKGGKNT